MHLLVPSPSLLLLLFLLLLRLLTPRSLFLSLALPPCTSVSPAARASSLALLPCPATREVCFRKCSCSPGRGSNGSEGSEGSANRVEGAKNYQEEISPGNVSFYVPGTNRRVIYSAKWDVIPGLERLRLLAKRSEKNEHIVTAISALLFALEAVINYEYIRHIAGNKSPAPYRQACITVAESKIHLA